MRRVVLLAALLGAALLATAVLAIPAPMSPDEDIPTNTPNHKPTRAAAAAAAPRFQQTAAKGAGGFKGTLGARAAAAMAAKVRAGAGSGAADQTASNVKGGEWWVQDVPWFLPPPPEWGPLPPTMYTSYFHRPRYPTLSTANYYPLYSKTDEYDAHLPASMSRRATLTQQMTYDNYVTNYYAHTHYSPTGNPNLLVSNPSMFGNSAAFGGLGEAHARVLAAQSTNNYFPLFSRTHDFYTSPGQTFSPHFASTGVSFLEQQSSTTDRRLRGDSSSDSSDSGSDSGSDSSSSESDEYGVPPPPMFAPPASYQLVGGGHLAVHPQDASFLEVESVESESESAHVSTTPFLSSTTITFRPAAAAAADRDE